MDRYIIKLFILSILVIFNINLANSQSLITDDMLITEQRFDCYIDNRDIEIYGDKVFVTRLNGNIIDLRKI